MAGACRVWSEGLELGGGAATQASQPNRDAIEIIPAAFSDPMRGAMVSRPLANLLNQS
jgi:hypothetical protein